jgi:hypothetical protein
LNKKIIAIAATGLLAACTSGQSHIEPGFISVNPLTYKLQFAVGTANYQVVDATSTIIPITGLNTVATYRQPDGLSATLVNSPTIIGPDGFVVPATSAEAGVDAGTNTITSTPQSVQPGAATPPTTFGQAGGVFSYGFLPTNSTNNSISGNGGAFAPYGQPFYTDAFSSDGSDISTVYLGGPPAYTNVQTGTFPAGFIGYTQGFNSFASTIAAGAYTLNLVVPKSPTTNGTLTSTATLGSTALLPTYTPPTVVEDGAGGATFTVTVPAGVTETILDVVDQGAASATATDCHPAYSPPFNYTVVDHTAGPAVATITLPDNVGPISPTAGTADPTICAGDAYVVSEIGVDYPAYEAGPGQPGPNALSETPAILGATGQDDITVSFPAATASGIYGMSELRAAQKMRPAIGRLHTNTYHLHAGHMHQR